MKLVKTILSSFLFSFLMSSTIVFAQSKMKIIEMESEAEALFNAHNYVTALEKFSELDRLRPATGRFLLRIGGCYIQLNQTVNALRFLERCQKMNDPELIELNYYLGRTYYLSHRMDEAIHCYSEFLRITKEEKNKLILQLVKKAERDIEMCRRGKELMSKAINLEVVNLGPEINTKYAEYAPVVSADETELIFTTIRPDKNKASEGVEVFEDEDVYISIKKNGKWTLPQQMSSNLNTYNHDASIALSPDGQTLFLYRFDEKGETMRSASGNLYTSRLKGKEWSIAERLNNKVNTLGWEPSASVTEDGQILYFTSDRTGGMGGTDLYFSKKLSDGSWDEPVNLGKEINTPMDEDCPFIHPDGKTLYFSSKGHNSMGGFDVFVSKFNEGNKSWGKPENIGYPISTAMDDVHFVIAPNAKRIYFSSIREGGYGDMDIYYANIGVKESAKVLLMTGIVTDSISKVPVEVTIRSKDKNKKEEVGTHTSNSSTGKYTLVLNYGKNYDLVFSSPKFGSHYESVDLTNETEYREVVKDIVLKQRNRDVVMQIGDEGSQQAVNAKISIVNIDSGEEIIVNEKTEPAGTYFVKLKEGNYYSIEVSKAGYVFNSMKINVPTLEEDGEDTIVYHLKLQPIKAGSVLLLRNVYFASNEFVPLVTSFPELDRLVEFMKQNPTAVIEISAHTDNVGNADYNLKLSDKRAKAVMGYLVGKGIAQARLKSLGYGKSKPIAQGETEEEKQKNRRVELKILKFE